MKDLDIEIGRLFMCGMPGPTLDKETEELIRDYNPGGIILFARNIERPVQVARLCRELQSVALKYHGEPLFLAVDQEGGKVARLRPPFTSFPGNAAIGADERAVEKAMDFGRITAMEMKLVGLNMDLAPVVDVRRGEIEKHLDGRSFGEDPEKVALLGRSVVQSLQANGIMAVAKHFPGLGRANLDPHFHLPRIEIDSRELMSVNMPPFRAAVQAGVSGIMTSHAVYPSLDCDLPATLSSTILNELLRSELGFRGLVLTDDLEMGAIAVKWGVPEGAAAAFAAGADVLLVCKEQQLAKQSVELIRKRIEAGVIPLHRLEETSERIGTAKTAFLSQRQEISFAQIGEYFGIA